MLEFLEKSVGFFSEHAGTSAVISAVLLDVILRVYPKGIPVLELIGRGCFLVGSLLTKVSELLPNKKPAATDGSP